jgi:hypothetical protein
MTITRNRSSWMSLDPLYLLLFMRQFVYPSPEKSEDDMWRSSVGRFEDGTEQIECAGQCPK